jgi:hypothetical protein
MAVIGERLHPQCVQGKLCFDSIENWIFQSVISKLLLACIDRISDTIKLHRMTNSPYDSSLLRPLNTVELRQLIKPFSAGRQGKTHQGLLDFISTLPASIHYKLLRSAQWKRRMKDKADCEKQVSSHKRRLNLRQARHVAMHFNTQPPRDSSKFMNLPLESTIHRCLKDFI